MQVPCLVRMLPLMMLAIGEAAMLLHSLQVHLSQPPFHTMTLPPSLDIAHSYGNTDWRSAKPTLGMSAPSPLSLYRCGIARLMREPETE